MANELTIFGGYSYAKGGDIDPGDGFAGLGVTISGAGRITDVIAAGADAVIPLGGLTSLGYGWFRNLDPTNNIKIKAAVGGTVLALLTPARPFAQIPLDSTIMAPSFQAVAGTPLLKYSLFPP